MQEFYKTWVVVLFVIIAALPLSGQYYPSAGHWERRDPTAFNLNPKIIQSAIDTILNNSSADTADLEIHHYLTFGREPFGDAVGIHKKRGVPSGLIIKDGYIIAEWGDITRADLTFSVSKSFLSATVGLLYDRGIIPHTDEKVAGAMAPILQADTRVGAERSNVLGTSLLLEPFETEHNKKITWEHLLRQTSDWEGVLWGKPDWADRPSGPKETWMTRERTEPGTVWEYNDARVNLLALAATNVARRPLQEILRDELMNPIGASATWRWYGYQNSWIVLDGRYVEVPSGGAHWGGGMLINALDMARYGLLTARNGKWNDKQILSEAWINKSRTPTSVKPDYGYMNWFLNTEISIPAAPQEAFYHLGAGANIIYVDPTNDLVIVMRWVDRSALARIIKEVMAAL